MIVTDLSVNKIWRLRAGNDNEFTISFIDSESDAFNVSGYTFTLKICNFGDKSNPVIELEEGDGITNGGATGVVTFALTDTQTAALRDSYYYEIEATFPDGNKHVLFQGKAVVSFFEYTGSTSTGVTATLNLSGSSVTATITLASDKLVAYSLALNGEESDIVEGKSTTFWLPYGIELQEARLHCTTAPEGSGIEVGIEKEDVSILSTNLTIDDGEQDSTDSDTPAVISTTTLPDNSRMKATIISKGSGTAGQGLKLTLIGTRI